MGSGLRSLIPQLKEHLPWLGVSIYIAWPFVTYYTDVVIPNSTAAEIRLASFGLSLAAFAITLIVLALRQTKTPKIDYRPKALYIAGTIVSGGMLIGLLNLLVDQGAANALLIAAGIVIGVGSSYVTTLYGLLYSQLSTKKNDGSLPFELFSVHSYLFHI